MMRNKKPQFNTNEEDIIELAEVLRKLESSLDAVRALSFMNNTQNQDLFDQVAIPPLDTDVESLGPQDYQIREVILGNPMLDTDRLMVTMGINEVFKSLEKEGAELKTLRRKNEILRGYLAKVVGSLDLKHLKETLNVALRDEGGVHLDPFLKAY